MNWLHDRDVLVRLERGAQFRFLASHSHHRSHEIADLRKRPLLSEHGHVLRARTALAGDIDLVVLEHDAVVTAHLGAEHLDHAELTGRATERTGVENILHAVEVHLVLKRDAHLVEQDRKSTRLNSSHSQISYA